MFALVNGDTALKGANNIRCFLFLIVVALLRLIPTGLAIANYYHF
jgi:hypothetical protein